MAKRKAAAGGLVDRLMDLDPSSHLRRVPIEIPEWADGDETPELYAQELTGATANRVRQIMKGRDADEMDFDDLVRVICLVLVNGTGKPVLPYNEKSFSWLQQWPQSFLVELADRCSRAINLTEEADPEQLRKN